MAFCFHGDYYRPVILNVKQVGINLALKINLSEMKSRLSTVSLRCFKEKRYRYSCCEANSFLF